VKNNITLLAGQGCLKQLSLVVGRIFEEFVSAFRKCKSKLAITILKPLLLILERKDHPRTYIFGRYGVHGGIVLLMADDKKELI
jgi:hypothetical protein